MSSHRAGSEASSNLVVPVDSWVAWWVGYGWLVHHGRQMFPHNQKVNQSSHVFDHNNDWTTAVDSLWRDALPPFFWILRLETATVRRNLH